MSNHELVIFCDTLLMMFINYLFSSGMVFVFFPSADVAANAMDKFKSSTVDSRHLFVRVLPNIHVSTINLQNVTKINEHPL